MIEKTKCPCCGNSFEIDSEQATEIPKIGCIGHDCDECVARLSQRQWVGLTRREFDEATSHLEDLEDCWIAIEAKLKERNE
jgi:hypothetical protein